MGRGAPFGTDGIAHDHLGRERRAGYNRKFFKDDAGAGRDTNSGEDPARQAHSLSLTLLTLRHYFSIDEETFYDKLTYWQSEDYMKAVPLWLDPPTEEKRERKKTSNAPTKGKEMSLDEARALGIEIE